MSKDSLFTVVWERAREPGIENVCTGLDPRTMVARLIQAVRNSGDIVIKSVEPE